MGQRTRSLVVATRDMRGVDADRVRLLQEMRLAIDRHNAGLEGVNSARL